MPNPSTPRILASMTLRRKVAPASPILSPNVAPALRINRRRSGAGGVSRPSLAPSSPVDGGIASSGGKVVSSLTATPSGQVPVQQLTQAPHLGSELRPQAAAEVRIDRGPGRAAGIPAEEALVDPLAEVSGRGRPEQPAEPGRRVGD